MVTTCILPAVLFLSFLSGTESKDISDGFSSKPTKYTVVYPHISQRWSRSANKSTDAKERNEKETVSYELDINNRIHLLVLKRNRDFLSKNFVQYSHDSSGHPTSSSPKHVVHCYYHGHVKGEENSLVILSTCSGLRGVIILGNETYGLEPVPQSPSNEHLLYLLKDIQSGYSVCGVTNETSPREHPSPFDPDHTLTSFLRRKRNLPQTNYVELVLVVDNLRYQIKQQNETAVREEMVEMANLLDGYYKRLNIRVALVGLEIFKDSNPFNVELSAGEVLKRFVDWRKTNLLPRIRHDVGQLIVGLPGPYGGSILGMAFVGTICSAATSGGINVFNGDNLPFVSTIVAHEMGHTLGMRHDNQRCDCDGNSCIMSASASGSTTFSTCSGDDFETLIRNGGGLCLKNPPSQSDLVGVAKCGNGLMEEGEQCDCGTPEECRNECCEAATCKFTSGSSCADGLCCTNCQVKVAGTPCRVSANACDLPEFCGGESGFCPEDFYMMDGLSCENYAAHCYEGRCQTYEFQCKTLFEPRATMADEICFMHANTQGDKYGNCGVTNSGKYIKCSVDDAMCGKVQCANLDANKPPIGAQITIQIIEGSTCVNADFNLGTDVLDPAYVNTGSPCAEGKACLDFKCLNASAIQPNPNCDAQTTCNGRGICNDQGNCHCNNGWAPPSCDKSGRGGSVDSGPAEIDYSLRNGLLIFFLLVVPVLIFVILLLLYIFRRDSLTRCAKGMNRKSNNRSQSAQNGAGNVQTNVNIPAAVQPPLQASPKKPEDLHNSSVPTPGLRYGELDYWNTSTEAAQPVPKPAPRQGPGVPKPFLHKTT